MGKPAPKCFDTVMLSGTSLSSGQLEVSALRVDAGDVGVGASRSLAFTVSNTGGNTVTITKSKPPEKGRFVAATALDEGTRLAPGEERTLVVVFTPNAEGEADERLEKAFAAAIAGACRAADCLAKADRLERERAAREARAAERDDHGEAAPRSMAEVEQEFSRRLLAIYGGGDEAAHPG